MLNTIVIVGNLCKDPEVRQTTSGKSVANLRIACTQKIKSGDGYKDETCFVGVVVWGKRAENIALQLKKGSPIFVNGRLTSRTWENAQGVKQYTTEIVAENVQFLDRTKEGTSPEAEPDFNEEA